MCFCADRIPQCEKRSYLILNETRYPGEHFSVSVVLVGFNFGRVSGPVYTSTLDSSNGMIADSQRTQLIEGGLYQQCTDLSYTDFSNQTINPAVLSLTPQQQFIQENQPDRVDRNLRDIYSPACDKRSELSASHCTALLTTPPPVYVNVTLEPCPLGFKLRGECVCDDILDGIINIDPTFIKKVALTFLKKVAL